MDPHDSEALSLDEVLPQVLNSLFKIFLQADRGFIGLVDEHGQLIPGHRVEGEPVEQRCPVSIQ